MTETTIDKLLGSRFVVEQPAKGYRIAVDTLLLASAVPACDNNCVLEFGCGVGGVMLALATRLPHVQITGLELQPAMASLCQSNISRNCYSDRLSVEFGDIAQPPKAFIGAFDHVMMNPPYHDYKTHSVSANTSKRLAHAESEEADLAVWVTQGARCLVAGGMLTMIHRADRLDEIVENLQRQLDTIIIKPIIARYGAEPKRVIIRGAAGKTGGVSTVPPLVLYGDDNRYSAAAELILREAQAMSFL